jgi:CBS-domain-containing membrane protein
VTGITVGLVQAGFGSGGLMLVIGSMGATSVLLFAIPDSPLSTPRNCIGGQMISALIGVIVRSFILEQ